MLNKKNFDHKNEMTPTIMQGTASESWSIRLGLNYTYNDNFRTEEYSGLNEYTSAKNT